MRNVPCTTENTELTEKIEASFTTKTQRHRGTQEGRLAQGQVFVLARDVFRRPFFFNSFLCLCVSVVRLFFGTARTPTLIAMMLLLLFPGCARKPDASTLVMIIESSPTNLDPRVGVDAYSERIDELLFDSLVRRDEHFDLQPWLAESWEIPDPQTYIFHLHRGVRFHNGQPLTARDVKWTFDSLFSGKLRSAKASTYAPVDHIDAPDDNTVIFHLKAP